jgi:Flp pilus assembly protein TadG
MKAILRKLAAFRHDQGGMALVFSALVMVVMVGFSALASEIALVMLTKARLQTSTDAAALAGAFDLNAPTAGSYHSSARRFSASAADSGLNQLPGRPVTVDVQKKCLASFAVNGVCPGSDAANAIQVTQTTTVDLSLSKVFGFPRMTVSATATAVGGGDRTYPPLNVMFVLDTTGSMNTQDTNCGLPGKPTRLDCAVGGMRQLMDMFNPTYDKIGLMVFPGLTDTTQAQYEFDCANSPNPTVASYRGTYNAKTGTYDTPVYQIVSLTNNYRASEHSNALDTNSNLVKAARAGVTGCKQGLEAIGGVGTFYADAISAAQAALTAGSATGAQNVMIVLSDGDASASAGNMPAGKATNQCRQAIAAAQSAASAGTWVYSVAYGAQNSGCSTDTPSISPCAAMRAIASDAAKFYSDSTGRRNGCDAGANNVNTLIDIFRSIGKSLAYSQLVADSTP